MKFQMTAAALSAALCTVAASAHDGEKPRVDDHAPIGVMADHYHKKGEWMASARLSLMGMTDPSNTMMGPQDMDMAMGMLGLMYAPSDKLTLAAGMSYVEKSMDMLMGGMAMSNKAKGLGDLRLTALIPLAKTENSRVLAGFGVSVPTGEKADTNAGGARLPITMQAGAGAWAVMPSLTYSYFGDGWSSGLQGSAKIWLDHNSFGEQPGDSYQVTSWASLTVATNFSLSARFAYDRSCEFEGAPVFASDARESLTAYAGANVYVGTHRFGVEVGHPVAQSRGTNALGKSTSFMLGWQKAF